MCTDPTIPYCYSQCIQPQGYSVIEINGNIEEEILVYSGDINVEAPSNGYDMYSEYQLVHNPPTCYCSKSWEGNLL